jgi:hypothetical protein
VTSDIGAVISKLDDSSADIAENAKYELIDHGADVIPDLVAALASLERYGKLSAIEVFRACGDDRAGPVLTSLLSDTDTTVREWAASALSEMKYPQAGPALARLHARLVGELVSPDFTEPVAVRDALTSLGLRPRLTPTLTRTLAQHTVHGDRWPVTQLPEVIRDLADHDQVVLYVMIWRVADDGRMYWTRHDTAGWSFDYSLPWPENVTAAREAALLEVAFVKDAADLVASVEWIGRDDVIVVPPEKRV